MKLTNLGGETSIKRFVDRKLKRLNAAETSFDALFPLMFAEKENIFYETDDGFGVRKMTYGEAYRLVVCRSAYLSSVTDDDRSVIALSMENGPDYLIDFWAILKSGHDPLLLNRKLDPETLSEAVRESGASLVVSDGASYGVRFLPAGTFHDEAQKSGSEETNGTGANENDAKNTDVRRFGERFLIMSSGTSSHVKLCSYRAEEVFSILRNAREIVSKSGAMQRHYNGELKLLTFLPFYHIFGFVAVYLWFAFFSRTFVELRDLAPETILSTVRRHGVTHIFAVPLFWEKVHEAAIRTIKGRGRETYEKFKKGMRIWTALSFDKQLSDRFSKAAFREVRKNLFGESISFLISGGGAIRTDTLKFFNAIGYHLANGYGMTEIGIASVELSDRASDRNAGFVGEPLQAYRFRIDDDGKLLVKSSCIASSIRVDGVETPAAEWFATGDLAREKKGRYEILGRNDDLIVGATGENLNPNLIEPKLRVAGAHAVALVGMEKNDATVPTVVVSVSEYTSDEALVRIRTELGRRLSDMKLDQSVGRIVFTTGPLLLPEEFKLNRKRIAADLRSGALPIRRPGKRTEEHVSDPVEEKIAEFFAKAIGVDRSSVTLTGDFFLDEGGSSLDYLLMQADIQKEFSVVLPGDFGREPHSVRTISKYIRNEIDGVDQVL